MLNQVWILAHEHWAFWKRPSYLELVKNEAWLPRISLKFFFLFSFYFCCYGRFHFLLRWVKNFRIFATFRDGDKVLIPQLGSNAHGSFLMISELLHGCRKGFIVVLEGKLGSSWRCFGFNLWKAIATETLAAKPTSQNFSRIK